MFNPNKVSFGRHETFALRYSWLSKGFHSIKAGLDITDADEATVQLGVGKNMVLSIRYWMRACQILEADGLTPSMIGNYIFDKEGGVDPFLEDEATIWLIHWLLSTNGEQATACYWFFNKFHRTEFTAQELQTALSDFVKDALVKTKRPASNTLKNDSLLIPRMYTPSKAKGRLSLEEALDSPLSLLRLISPSVGDKGYQSKSEARPGLPVGILAYAVAQLMTLKSSNAIPIEELMYSRDHYPSPGSIFRLTESGLITKLEILVHLHPDTFAIRETAGIHQLYCLQDNINPIVFLQEHYENVDKGAAA